MPEARSFVAALRSRAAHIPWYSEVSSLVRSWCVKRRARILTMKRRRLRKLVPDAELIRRRAAGETFRELARDYEVAHTTLGRYFARPEVRKELRQAVEELRAAQRAAAARRAAERRQEQELRRKARKQAAAERGQARHARAAVAAIASRRRPARSEYELWLDERDAVVPLTRVDRYSQLDEMAARAVAAGGGMQAVLEATDLRTRENVVGSIDSAILVRALDNDALAQAQPPPL